MRTLPTMFSYDKFDFTQLRRQGQIALFSKKKPEHSEPTFEVVRIQVHKAGTMFGKNYPDRELMPPSEDWGVNGWSYPDLASAKAKFNSLTPD